MILYCVVTKTFIFDLFYAAIVPALLALLVNLLAIALVVRWKPELAPLSDPVASAEKWLALRDAAPVLVLMLAVIAGVFALQMGESFQSLDTESLQSHRGEGE